MQYSIHSPSSYLQLNWQRLLPAWSSPVASVMVVLQPCRAASLGRTVESETEKAQLREQFMQLGDRIVAELHQRGFLADFFDPKTGLPMGSSEGAARLDDVAVVRSLLGYPIESQAGCCLALHPTWGYAVYPSTLVSSAPPAILEAIVREVAQQMGDRLQPSLETTNPRPNSTAARE